MMSASRISLKDGWCSNQKLKKVMQYVDGFVLPARKERMADYKIIVEVAAKIWKEHVALEYWEWIGDDLGTEKGTGSFAEMTNANEDENVIFGWVMFESREARDIANEKVVADFRFPTHGIRRFQNHGPC